jgi:hypothetical protein
MPALPYCGAIGRERSPPASLEEKVPTFDLLAILLRTLSGRHAYYL